MAQDTIFALCSGGGAAGVAVIRISGPLAFDSAAKLCTSLPRPRQAALRLLRHPVTRTSIDSALMLVFPAPTSFTGEDVVEIHCHGSIAVIREIQAVLGAIPGLRAAEAGEFTARAFENGKLDLIEVEALGDLLAAETHAQARLARRNRDGLRDATTRWRADLIEALALVEAGIDFSDEGDVPTELDSELQRLVGDLIASIEAAVVTQDTAERIRRGFRVAILGKPNAGKSTLINALAARDVAITSPIPGTTRDAIEVHLDLGGLPVTLIDTAGMRETSDALERLGIERAVQAAQEADLVLWLSDDGAKPGETFPHAINVRSKADIASNDTGASSDLRISVVNGDGVPDLIEAIRKRASESLSLGDSAVVVAQARQRTRLEEALAGLKQVQVRAGNQEDLELQAEDLRRSILALDRLVGRVDCEDILGHIFARFCIGK